MFQTKKLVKIKQPKFLYFEKNGLECTNFKKNLKSKLRLF